MTDEDDFGAFGEIDVKNCNICGKTTMRSKCWGVVRERDVPKGYGPTAGLPQIHICIKCLLKGLCSVCNGDKKKINDYLDLFIKTSLMEKLIQDEEKENEKE
jgi:hypothetical protein